MHKNKSSTILPTTEQVKALALFWEVKDDRTIIAWVKKGDKRLTHPDSVKIFNPNPTINA